jgi:hypothetical protein
MVRIAGVWTLLALLCCCASDSAAPDNPSAKESAPPDEWEIETFVAQSGLYYMLTVSGEWTQDWDLRDPSVYDLHIRRRLVPAATSSEISTQLMLGSEVTVQQAFSREKEIAERTLVSVVAPIEVKTIFSGPDSKLWGRQGSYCGTLRYGGEVGAPACMLIAAVAFRAHVVRLRGIAVARSDRMMDFLTREQKAIVRSFTFFDTPQPPLAREHEIESDREEEP